jgi:hypothetical protein
MNPKGILYYKATLEARFPLILIFGREPNDSNDTVDSDNWQYDFSDHPRCAFWNISHSLIGGSCDLTAAQLKAKFRQRNCSPILYSDSSPISIPNSALRKAKIRKGITEEEIDNHIDLVFSNKEIIDRVKIVILSGLYKSDFSYSKNLIIQKCADKGIVPCEVPFFYGTNKKDIISQAENYLPIIKSICNQFFETNKV